jgi:hypothetical protein
MDEAGAGLDVLEAGPPPARRRPGLIAVVLVVSVALAGAGWWSDHRERAREFDTLLACVRGFEQAAGSASARVSMMSNYIQPALNSGTPELSRGLYALVEQAAAAGLPRLEVARAGCSRVHGRPWHSGFTTAKSHVMVYLNARILALSATAADGRENFPPRPELLRQRDRARAALAALAPGSSRERAALAALPG